MSRKKIERQGAETRIKVDLMGLELKSLAAVIDEWSGTMVRDKRKLLAFRDAMMAGLKMGKKESVEREIVEDEYLVMCDVVQFLEDAGGVGDEVVCQLHISECELHPFHRAVPCPPEEMGSLQIQIDSGTKCEVVARDLVVKRLPISESTVKNAVNPRKSRRYDTSAEQRFLVSLFLDACSHPASDEQLAKQVVLLDTLVATGYPAIAVYYLVQRAHEVPRPISLYPNARRGIEALCNKVAPERQRRFSDLSELPTSE